MLFPKLAEITTRNINYVNIDESIFKALEKMVEHNHRRILIKDGDKFSQFTSHDIIHLKALGTDFNQALSSLHLQNIPSISKDANILDTLDFIKNDFEIICVLDSDKSLLGIATASDILASIDPHIILENTKIGDIFKEKKNFITAKKDDDFDKVVQELVSISGDCILVVDDEYKVEGIITSKDINRAIFSNLTFEKKVHQYMVSPVSTLPGTCAVNEAIVFIQKQSFHRVIVVDEKTDKLIGLITQQDLISQSYVTWSKIVKEHFSEMEEIVNIFKNRNQKLSLLASTDALTGIYNRRMFEDLFEQSLALRVRHKVETSMVLLDIDKFKNINDTYGHDIGDIVLKDVVNIVKEHLRTSDTFARWGGEEFVILLKHTDLENSFNVCEKLRNAINSYNFEKVGKVTCSFGLTQILRNDTIETTIKRADNALYEAKKTGRNKTVIGEI